VPDQRAGRSLKRAKGTFAIERSCSLRCAKLKKEKAKEREKKRGEGGGEAGGREGKMSQRVMRRFAREMLWDLISGEKSIRFSRAERPREKDFKRSRKIPTGSFSRERCDSKPERIPRADSAMVFQSFPRLRARTFVRMRIIFFMGLKELKISERNGHGAR